MTGFTLHSGWGERELKFQHVATKFSCLNLQTGFLPLKGDSKCSWFNFDSFIHLIPLGHQPASRWQMVLAFALTEGFVVPLLATQKDFSAVQDCEIWRVYISILWIQCHIFRSVITTDCYGNVSSTWYTLVGIRKSSLKGGLENINLAIYSLLVYKNSIFFFSSDLCQFKTNIFLPFFHTDRHRLRGNLKQNI